MTENVRPRDPALSVADQRWLDSFLDEFERSWSDGELARRIEQLPPPGSARRLAALSGLVAIDLRRRWQSGTRVPVDHYLRRFPELNNPDTASHLSSLSRQLQDDRTTHGSKPGLRQDTQSQGHTLNEPAVPRGSTSGSRGQTTPATGNPALGLERLGRYRILKKLGQGGMGAVYLAHDEQLDRQVALKVPSFPANDADAMERFLREARAAATLSHPNLCPVYDVGQIDGTHYMTMSYVEGQSLADRARAGLTPQETTTLVRKVALALHEAHARGVIHRDLKPANIMVTPRGEPVVMDFGLARRANRDVRLTQSGTVLGTPAYMSPEQVEGDVEAMGPASDVYSVGVILYELLTGRVPYQGSLGQVMSQILAAKPAPPTTLKPGVDAKLEAICLRAMARNPKDRFASMQELADALEGAPVGSAAAERGSKARWPLVAAGLVGIAALVVGVVLFLNTRHGRVRIEINDPGATVTVDGEKVQIGGVGETITLAPGAHALVVRRGDVVVETRDFTVTRGDNPVLKITLPPADRKRAGKPVSKPPAGPGTIFALAAGVNQYDRKDLFKNLKYAEPDAIDLANVLRQGAARPDNVVSLTTGAKPHLTPRRHNFLRELKALAGAAAEADTLVVSFAGYEVLPKDTEEYYLGLADADPDEPKNLLSLSKVYEEVARSRAGLKLVLVDACRPEAARGRKLEPPAGITTFFGCSVGEFCYEDDEHRHGVFSYYIIEGLRGSADLNRDGRVTLDELKQFIEDGVPEHARRKLKQKQTPQLLGKRPEDRPLLAVGKKPSPPVPPAPPEPVFRPVFNGKNLAGWYVDSGSPDAWSVENGDLVCRATPRAQGWLLTKEFYSDFVLRLEYQLDAGGNSGIAFRAAAGEGLNLRNAAMHLEIQLLDDSSPRFASSTRVQKTGALYNLALDRLAQIKPTGEWNTFEMEVRGASLRVSVNGQQVLQTDLTNFVDQANRLPGLKRSSGRIGLQNWGDSASRFRKIEVKDLSPPAPVRKTENAPPPGPAPGFKPLFNGKDLSGWKGEMAGEVDPGWSFSFKEGDLVCTGNPRGYLYTEKTCRN
jgi:Protein kinase domain/3-keto-disaccharide hydrolase/Caspase domain